MSILDDHLDNLNDIVLDQQIDGKSIDEAKLICQKAIDFYCECENLDPDGFELYVEPYSKDDDFELAVDIAE